MVPRPHEKQRVYDLVQDAGIDVGNWADFDGEHPASNPKYCYNWAFFDKQRQLVAICLWYAEMQTDELGVFQKGNSSRRRWNPNQRKRAGEMDMAIQFANNQRLPIQVILVSSMPNQAVAPTPSPN